MPDQDIFFREYQVIEEAEQILESGDYSQNPLYQPYCDLLEAYKKLFRQTKRLVKMGDRMQQNLNELNSELQCHKEQLAEMSYVDGLTSIANRRRFNEYLESEWNRALRSKKSLSLLILDIDYFKPFNDNYGHTVGDECLVEVAQALKKSIKRSSDLVCRYGGEEFAAILPDTDLSAAISLAQDIQQNIHQMSILHEYSPIASEITVSIGVANRVPDTNYTYQDLLESADKLLYAAKEAGRNQVKAQQVNEQGQSKEVIASQADVDCSH